MVFYFFFITKMGVWGPLSRLCLLLLSRAELWLGGLAWRWGTMPIGGVGEDLVLRRAQSHTLSRTSVNPTPQVDPASCPPSRQVARLTRSLGRAWSPYALCLPKGVCLTTQGWHHLRGRPLGQLLIIFPIVSTHSQIRIDTFFEKVFWIASSEKVVCN